jgi:hypothetical protein
MHCLSPVPSQVKRLDAEKDRLSAEQDRVKEELKRSDIEVTYHHAHM